MTALYQVILVQEDDACGATATLHPSPFASRDPASAKTFADAFNERELAEPLGFWAVVRRGRQEGRPL